MRVDLPKEATGAQIEKALQHVAKKTRLQVKDSFCLRKVGSIASSPDSRTIPNLKFCFYNEDGEAIKQSGKYSALTAEVGVILAGARDLRIAKVEDTSFYRVEEEFFTVARALEGEIASL